MTIIGLVVFILIIIFLCWLASTYLSPPFRMPVLVLLVVIACIVLLAQFVPGLAALRIR